MRRTLVLFGLLASLGTGVLLGWFARREAARAGAPPRPVRPAYVEAALRAWAEHDRDGLLRGVAEARTLPAPSPAIAAEIRFLEAVGSGRRRSLATVAEEEGRFAAGARARWVLIEQTRASPAREAMRDAFARAYPEAWVLRSASRPDGP